MYFVSESVYLRHAQCPEHLARGTKKRARLNGIDILVVTDQNRQSIFTH